MIGDPAAQDKQFLLEAAGDGMAAARLGRLAARTAERPEIREYAQRMADEHSRLNVELMQVAAQLGLVPGSELMLRHRALIDRLACLAGAEFEREYLRAMVEEHARVVAEFEKEFESGVEQGVRRFAAAALPRLRAHLEMARDLQGRFGTP